MRNSSDEDLQSVILDENNDTNKNNNKAADHPSLDKQSNFVNCFIEFLLCCFVSVN